MSVTIERLTGPALQAAIPAVSRLRISVFRDWPYLYDGDAAYEAEYLADFVQADSAVVIVARDGEEIVGAATASALTAHTPEFADLFAAHGYDPTAVFYCGESVLLPTYRGQGIGHAFFDAREAARATVRWATPSPRSAASFAQTTTHAVPRTTARSIRSGASAAMFRFQSWSEATTGPKSGAQMKSRTQCSSGCASSEA
jgi:GNAT superfamily N-acetyltransferase